MNIESLLLEKLRELPPDKQYEMLDFAEFLHAKTQSISSEKTREKFSTSKRILGAHG